MGTLSVHHHAQGCCCFCHRGLCCRLPGPLCLHGNCHADPGCQQELRHHHERCRRVYVSPCCPGLLPCRRRCCPGNRQRCVLRREGQGPELAAQEWWCDD